MPQAPVPQAPLPQVPAPSAWGQQPGMDQITQLGSQNSTIMIPQLQMSPEQAMAQKQQAERLQNLLRESSLRQKSATAQMRESLQNYKEYKVWRCNSWEMGKCKLRCLWMLLVKRLIERDGLAIDLSESIREQADQGNLWKYIFYLAKIATLPRDCSRRRRIAVKLR